MSASTAATKSLPAKHAHTHHSVLPHWLTHLGPLGLFAVAVIDSSVIPLPLPGSTDLLLLWLVSHHGNPWILTACAVVGSAVGGYTAWSTGRQGGETALGRYMGAKPLTRITAWVENHSILAVFIPAILPPPFPLSPFLLASGALGVSRKRFFQVFTVARTLRYGLITWLGVAFGRGVVRMWSGTLEQWFSALAWVFAAFLMCSLGFAFWKSRRDRNLVCNRAFPFTIVQSWRTRHKFQSPNPSPTVKHPQTNQSPYCA